MAHKKVNKSLVTNSNVVPVLTGKYHIDDDNYAKMEFDRACCEYIDKGNGLICNAFNKVAIKHICLPALLCVVFIYSIYLVVCSFSLQILAVISLILLTFTCLIFLLRKVFFYFVEPRIILDNIKQTECYKGIIEKIQSYELKNILYIYSNKSRVVLCDDSGNKVNINFKKFDYPNLSMDKQAILIAGIINDLFNKDKKSFKITNDFRKAGLKCLDCDNEFFSYKNNSYNFENLFVAINQKNINNMKVEEVI